MGQHDKNDTLAPLSYVSEMSSPGGLHSTVGVRPFKWLSLVHQIRRMKSAVERLAGAMMVAVIYFVVTILAAWTVTDTDECLANCILNLK